LSANRFQMRCNSAIFRKFIIRILGVLLISISQYLPAQLSVTPGTTAPQILNILNGGGMVVSNVTMSCPDTARATFNGTTSNIGINQGVLLSTGDARNSPGPNLTSFSGTCQLLPSGRPPGDADLTNILTTFYGSSPTPLTRDACILEFDVQPGCDTLRMSFVFASEEYPEYVGSGFSDAFGIFVSGPGITGAPNIALLPTNTPFPNPPILLNYVNAVTNSGLFVNNTGGLTVEYDGFTVKLTAKIRIPNICGTYHVKIALADGYDCFLDSGVFLEQGSMFCTYNSVDVTTTVQNARRNCANGVVQFRRFGDTTSVMNVPYTIAGNAVNGVDYQTLSGTLNFGSNTSTVNLNIIPLLNGNPNQVDTVRIIYANSLCSVVTFDTAIVYIFPANLARAGNDTTLCLGQTTPLGASNTPGFSYSWSPGTGLSSSTISNPVLTSSTAGVFSYQVSQTDNNGCLHRDTVIVTVQSLIGNNTIGSAQTICNGQTPLALNGTNPSGGSGTYTFQWQSSGDNLNWGNIPGQTASGYSPGALSNSIYYRRQVNSGACTGVNSGSVFILVLPSITGNNIGFNQTICSGSVPTALTGTSPLGGNGVYSYVWETSTNQSSWSSIPGAVNIGYSPPIATASLYYRRIANSASCVSTSNSISIVVDQAISSNILSSAQTLCVGDTPASLSGSTPTGGNGTYSYQWESSSNMSTWSPVIGGTQINHSPGILSASIYFRRVVSSGVCAANTSSLILITALPSVGVNTIGSTQTICSGNTPTALTGSLPTGGAGTYSYTWQSSLDNSTWSNLTGGNSQNYGLLPALTSTVFIRRLVVSGPCNSTSSSISIQVVTGISNNVIGNNQTICSGNSPSLFTGTTPAGGNGLFAYQWESSTNNSSWTSISGQTGQNYLSGNLNSTIYLRRTVSSGVCNAIAGSSISVLVEQPLGSNLIGSSQTVCIGSIPTAFVGSIPTGGSGVYTYIWYSSTDNLNWNLIAGGSTQNFTPGVTNFQTFYQRVVNGGLCSPSISSSISISAQPLPGNNIVGTSQTICQGFSPQILTGSLPTGGSGSYSYQWQSSLNSISWTNITGANTIDYQPPALSGITYYQRVVSAGVCPALTSSALIIIIDPPVTNNTISTSQTICQGGVPIQITGSNPGGGNGSYTYQWQSSLNNSTWTSISTGTSLNFTPDPLSVNTYLRRLVNSGACSQPSNSHSVTVNPGLGAITVGASQTICQGNIPSQLTGTLPTGGSGVYAYQWQSSSDNVSWVDVLSANGQNFSPPAPSGNIYYRRLVSSGACTNVAGNIVSFTVVLTPSNNTIQSSQTICGGDIVNLTGSLPTGGVGVFSYVWEISNNNTTWFPATGGTGQNFTSTAINSLTYFRRVLTAPPCAASSSSSVAIQPLPAIGNNTVTNSQTICTGGSLSALTGTVPTGGTGVYTYTWESSSDGTNWVTIPLQTGLTYNPGGITQTTYIRRRVLSGACNVASSMASLIIEQPIGSNTLAGNQTICSGQTATGFIGANPTGGSGIYTYQWQISTDNSTWSNIGGAIFINYSPPTPVVNTYYRRIVSGSLCAASTSTSSFISILPTITGNIIGSNQTICNGTAPATLTGSIPSGGNGIYSYQWQSSSNNSIWNSIPGEIGINYSPPILNNVAYYRRVGSSSNCSGVNSNAIVVTVQGGITNNQIISNQTICAGSTPTQFFGSFPAGGTGVYTYQWLSSSDNSSWVNIPTTNTINYTSGNLSSTTYFARVVSSGLCPPNTSAGLFVFVNPPIGNNLVGNNQTICANTAPALFTGSIPTGGTGTYSYIWQSSSNNSTWINIGAGGLSVDYQSPSLTSVMYFRRVVNSASCIPSTSNLISISVLPALGNNTINSSQTICTGSTPAGFTGPTPTGGTGAYTYQWQFSGDSVNWTSIAGATLSVYGSSPLFSDTYFRRVVSSGPCTGNSSVILVRIEQPLGSNTISSNQSLCAGSIALPLSGTLPSGGSGVYTYQWQSSANSVTWGNIPAPGGTTAGYAPGQVNNSLYFRRVIVSGPCAAITSNVISLNVDPVIGNNQLLSNQTICRGSSANPVTSLNPTGGNGIYNYQWESSSTGSSWVIIPGATNQAFSPGSPISSQYFRRTIVSGACFSMSDTVVLIVNQLVGGNTILANQTICFGQSPNTLSGTLPSGGTGQFGFQWQFSPDNQTFYTVPGETNQNYAPGQLFASTYFRRLVTSGVCPPMPSDTILVFVNPAISDNLIGNNQTICIGESPLQITGSTPSGGVGSYSYTWESSTNNSLWLPVIGVVSQNYTPPLLMVTTYYRRVVSSSTCTPNTSSMASVTMVPGLTNNTITANQTICENSSPANFNGSLPVGGSGVFTYQWQSSNDNSTWVSLPTGTNQGLSSPGSITLNTYYRRVVTSGFCTNLSTSVLVVTQPPIGNNTITNNQSICAGLTPSPFTGSFPSGGSGIYSYQWQSSPNNSIWANLTGANLSDYSSVALNATTYFRRIVTGGPCAASVSPSISVVVQSGITSNTLLSNQTVCDGNLPAVVTGLTPSGGSGVFNYQWQSSFNNSSWVNLPGEIFQNFVPPLLSSTTYYRRIAGSGFCSDTTSGVIVRINQPLGNNTILSDQTLCQGTSGIILTGTTPTGGNGLFSYQWQSSFDQISWAGASGGAGVNYTLPSMTTTTYYRRVVVSAPCPPATSSVISIIVVPPPAGNSIGSSQTICSGALPSLLTGSAPSGGNGIYTLIWESSSNNSAWAFAGVGQNFQPPVIASNIYYRRTLTSGPCTSLSSPSVSITVVTPLGNNTISSSQTLCAGNPFITITGPIPTGGSGVISYQWESSPDGVVWSSVTGSVGQNFPGGTVSATTYFRRMVTATPCVSLASNVVGIIIDTNVGNNIISGQQSICTGTSLILSGGFPVGGNGIFTYQWESSSNNSTWSGSIGTNQDFTTGPLSSNRYFRRLVFSGTCAPATSSIFALTVEPNVSNNTISSNQTICSGSVPALITGNTPNGGNGQYIYVWQSSTTLPVWNAIPGETNISYQSGSILSTTYFRRIAQSQGVCPGTLASVQIQVDVEPQLGNNVIINSQTICIGQAPFPLTGTTVTGGSGGITYQWQISFDNLNWSTVGGGTNQNYSPSPIFGATYYRRVALSNGVCPPSTSNTVDIIPITPITNNSIQTAQTICAGTFPNTLTGSLPSGGVGSYSYQWQTSFDNVNWLNTIGSTGINYSPPFLSSLVYFRRVVVAGTCSNASNVIPVNVLPPIGNNTISANQTLCMGINPLLLTGPTITGGTGSYTYQWQSSTDNLSWLAITGGTTASYQPGQIPGGVYYRRLSISGACNFFYTNSVLILIDQPINNNTLSTSATLCAGSVMALTGSNPGGGNGSFTYQWESSSNNSVWAPVSGVTSQSYTTGLLSSTVYYRRIVGSGICPVSTSSIIQLTIQPALGSNSIGNSQTLCSGNVGALITGTIPSGGNGVYNYQWQSSSDLLNWNSVSATTSYAPGTITTSLYFRRIITSGACTIPDTSLIVNLLADPPIANNSITGNQSVCTGQIPPGIVGSQPSGGTGFYTFVWESSSNNTNWAVESSGTSPNYVPVPLSGNTYFRRIVQSGACPPLTSNVLTYLSIPGIFNNITGPSQALCIGSFAQSLTGSLPTGGSGTFTYLWESSPDSLSWSIVPGGTNSGQTVGTPLSSVYYRRIVFSGTCQDTSVNLIRVDQPIGNNLVTANQTVCQFTAPAPLSGFLPSGGSGFYSYQWESSPDNILWGSVPGETLQNYAPGPISGTIYYRRIVIAGPCAGSTSNVLSMQIQPAISNNLIGNSQTLCTGQFPSNLTGSVPSGGIGNYTYQWQTSLDNSTWASIPGGTGLNRNVGTITQSIYYRRVVSSGVCVSPSSTASILIQPPIGNTTIGTAQTICVGTTPSPITGLLPSGGTGTYSYQWQTSINLTSWTSVPAETNQNYVLGPISASFYFRRIILTGICQDTSQTVEVQVYPFISRNFISSGQTLCSNQVPTLLVGTLPQGGDGTYAYSWESSTNNSTWQVASGGSQIDYQPPILSTTTYFRRRVTSGPCDNLSSSLVIVIGPPLGNNLLLSNQTICLGTLPTPITGNLPSGGTGVYSYSWQSSSNNSSWSSIPGQTGLNYTPGGLTQSLYLRRIIASGACLDTALSLSIIVEDSLSNNSIFPSQTICQGILPLTLSGSLPSGGGGNWIYTWQSSANNSTWSVISGATLQDFLPPVLNQTMYYRRIVSGSACPVITSSSVVVEVHLLIGNNLIGNSQTLCSGAQPTNLTGTLPTGGNGSYQYIWLSSTNGNSWTSVVGGTGTTYLPPNPVQSTYYRRLVISGFCSPDSGNTVLIQADLLVGNNLIGNTQTICSGTAPQLFTGTLPTGGSGGYLYTWQSSTDNSTWSSFTGGTGINYQAPPISGNSYIRRIVAAGLCPPDTSTSFSITVQPALGNNTILSSQTICAGTVPQPLSGSLPTGGIGLYSYTWQSSTNNSTWSNVSNGTAQNFNTGTVLQNTYFRRIVTGGICPSDTSLSISIQVQPSIGNNQIGVAQTICGGNSPNLITGTVPTGGSGSYTYSWQSSNNNSTWSNLVGSNQQNWAAGVLNVSTYYRRLVSGGVCVDTTTSILITVTPGVGNNNISPDQTLCFGQATAPLTGTLPTGGGGIYLYQWESSLDNLNWNGVTNGTTQSLSPGNLSTTVYFRRIVSSNPCSPVTSLVVQVVIHPSLGNNQIVADQTLCTGSSPAAFTGSSPSGGNGSYTYLWLSSITPTGPWAGVGGGTNMSYSSGPLNATTYFRRVVLSGPCVDTSTVISVVTTPGVGNNIVTTNQTICVGTAPNQFTGTNPTGGSGVYTYQWESSTNNTVWTVMPGEINASFTSGALSSTSYFRRITTAGPCPASTSNSIRVIVESLIGDNSIQASQTICSGDTPQPFTGSLPTGGNGLYSYTWESSLNNSSWSIVIGGSTQNYSSGPLTTNVYFRRVVSGGVCAGDTSSVLSVQVIPTIQNNTIASAQTVCQNVNPNILIGSLPIGGTGFYQYQWQSGPNNVNWVNINQSTQQDHNPGPLLGNVYFRRIVTSGACTNTTVSVMITVDPVIGNNVLLQNQTICTGQAAGQITGSLPTGGNGQSTYVWQSSLDNSSWTQIIGSVGQSLTPGPITNNVYFRRIVVSPPCAAHTSTSISITVTPVIGNNSIQADQTICSGQLPTQITGTFPTGGNGSYNYQWVSGLSNAGPWGNVTGGVSQDYTPGGLSVTTYFRRLVLSAPCSDTSAVVGVFVNPGVGSNIIGNSQTICAGSVPASVTGSTPTGGNGNYAYSWESSPDGLTWNTVSGGTQLSYTSGALSSTTYFRRIVTAGPCPSSTSNAIQIQVDQLIGDNVILQNQTICSGTVPAVLTGSTPSGGNLNYAYQWQSSPDGLIWTSLTTGVLQNYTSGALTVSTYFRRLITAGICSGSTSQSILVQVDPVVSGNTILQAQTICQGTAPNTLTGSNPLGGTGVYTYLWESSANNLTWSGLPGETQQNLSPGVINQTVYFRRIVTSGACSSTSASVQITILQLVGNNLIGSDQTICTGQSALALTGTIPTGGNNLYTYSWESSADNLNWTTLPGTNTTGFTPGSLTSTLYLRRLVSSGPCAASTSQSVTLLVTTGLSNNLIGSDQTICTGAQPAQFTGTPPAGGSGSYTYQWLSSNFTNGPWNVVTGANQSTYTSGVLFATTYFRRFVGGGPCSDTSASVAVIVNPPIGSNQISANQTVCSGTSPAQFTGALPTGGNGSYLYQWESSTDNNTWNAIAIGTNQNYTEGVLSQIVYYRRIVQAGPCTAVTSSSLQIFIDPIIGDNSISSNQTICSGMSPQSLTGSSPSGGNGTYTYVWESSLNIIAWANTGVFTQNYTPGVLTQTVYFRRIVSAGVCNASTSSLVEITVEPNIGNNTLQSSQTICVNTSPAPFTGSLPTGGSGLYTYQWQSSLTSTVWTNIPGETNQSYSSGSLIGNIYFRRYVNSGMCTDTSSFISILVNPIIGNNLIGNDQTLCAAQVAGIFTGTIPTGGNGLYQYVWETSSDNLNWLAVGNGTNQSLIFGQISGSLYFRRMILSGPCTPHTSQVVSVFAYPLLGSNLIAPDQTICAGTLPVTITGANPTGGTGAYSYQWQSGASLSGPWFNISNGTNLDYSSGVLQVSTYFRRVINSLPCSDTSLIVSVLVNPAIGNNTILNSQTICIGSSFSNLTGSQPTGGNTQFIYDWESSSDNLTWLSTGISTQNFTGNSPLVQVYFRRIIQAGICAPATSNVVHIGVDQPGGNNQIGSEQTICANTVPQLLTGSLPSGGSGTYTYIWETSPLILPLNWLAVAGVSGQSYQPATLTQTLYFRRRVISGVCPPSTSNQVIVWVNPAIGNNIIGTAQTICTGSIPGMLTGSLPTGGNNSFTYQWQSSADLTVWNSISGETNNAYSSGVLTVHTYFRRLVQAGICNASTSVSVLITVNQAIGNNIIGSEQTICNGQTPQLLTGTQPSGGNGSYTYQWQSSSNQAVWSAVAGSATYQPPVLTFNVYYRRVVSAGACTAHTSDIMAITVLDVIGDNSIGTNQTLCIGQVSSVLTGTAPSGGTGTYQYQWQSSADNVVFSGISGATTVDYDPGTLGATTYFRRIVGSGLCQSISGIVQIRINPVPVITVADTSICLGSSVTLTATADVTGGVFTWNVPPFNTGTVSVSPLVTTTYTVDYVAGGCPATSVSPVVTVTAPPVAVIQHTDSVIFCANTSVVLTASPAGATYEWTRQNTGIVGTGPTYSASSSGTYILLVSDGNACQARDTIVLTQRPPIVLQTQGAFASCSGGNDGSAGVSVSGGTAPYTYLWSEGSTTSTIFGLASGVYSVLVTDGLGCIQTTVVNLVDPAAVSATVSSISHVSCFGQRNGSITVGAVGGRAPYSYSWSTTPVQNGPTATNLPSGSYTVLVTDANGCFTTAGGLVLQPTSPLIAQITPPPAQCPGERFQIFGNGIGGTPPYTYAWTPATGLSNPTAQNPFVTYVISTSYTLIVTDANGCKDSHTDLVTVHPGPKADFRIIFVSEDSTLYNNELTDLKNYSTPAGMSYVWNFGDGKQDTAFEPQHQYLTEGSYTITLIVETKEGCKDTTSVPVKYKNQLKIFVPTAFSPNGDGVNDFFKIAYLNLTNFNVFIYDRWGNKLYQSQDPAFRWDGSLEGSPLQEGVYTVYLKGIGSKGEQVEYSGTVTLIR
jgi:gliding motility-associated-like protein